MLLVWEALAAVGIVAADQLFKAWCAANLIPGIPVDLIPGLVHMVYVENSGAAFSLLEGMRVPLLVLTVAALGVIAVVLARRWPRHPLGVWGLVLVAGGAAGNFIDRAAQGYVVDMFEFQFIRFAIFNVADIFITIGGVLFCVYLLFLHEKKAEDRGQEIETQ
jgi:signal peptidase II